MACKGAIIEAEDVFFSLPKRDIVSWNAMLSAYVEQDLGAKALQLFRLCKSVSTFGGFQLLLMLSLFSFVPLLVFLGVLPFSQMGVF